MLRETVAAGPSKIHGTGTVSDVVLTPSAVKITTGHFVEIVIVTLVGAFCGVTLSDRTAKSRFAGNSHTAAPMSDPDVAGPSTVFTGVASRPHP